MAQSDPAEGDSSAKRPGNAAGGSSPAADLIKEWTVLVAGALAGVALSFGIFVFLVDALDQALLDIDEAGGLETLIALPLHVQIIPYLAIAGAGVFGLWLAWELDVADEELFKVVAGVSLAATVVAWFVGGLIGGNLVEVGDAWMGSLPADDVSIDFVGLLINSIVAGITAALAGVVSAWLARNQAPADASSVSDLSTTDAAGPTDD